MLLLIPNLNDYDMLAVPSTYYCNFVTFASEIPAVSKVGVGDIGT